MALAWLVAMAPPVAAQGAVSYSPPTPLAPPSIPPHSTPPSAPPLGPGFAYHPGVTMAFDADEQLRQDVAVGDTISFDFTTGEGGNTITSITKK